MTSNTTQRLAAAVIIGLVVIATTVGLVRNLRNPGPNPPSITPSTSAATTAALNTPSTQETSVSTQSTTLSTQPNTTPYEPVLERVRRRRELRCGIDGNAPGFSTPLPAGRQVDFHGFDQEYGDFTGFEATFCKVIATAIFETDKPKVHFIPLDITPNEANDLDNNDRFKALADGNIDILFRRTTWTADRDIDLGDPRYLKDTQIITEDVSYKSKHTGTGIGFDFGPVIYHDAQRFLIPTSGSNQPPTLDDINNRRVCVLGGSSNERNLSLLPSLGVPNHTSIPVSKTADLKTEFIRGINGDQKDGCNAVSADDSRLRADFKDLLDKGSAQIIEDQIARSPLAPAITQNDSQWKDIVSYAIYATIYADELHITQTTVDNEKRNNINPLYQRLLGVEGRGNIGGGLGLQNDFAYLIIKTYGNYQEIYHNNLYSILGVIDPKIKNPDPSKPSDYIISDVRRGPNRVWNDGSGGVLVSPPF